MKDSEIIDGVLHEFAGLAKHPRQSHHEKAVSDYIAARLHELGVDDVVQDEVYNIIANVPATAGYESRPLTILQGHMDMVCVAKPGVTYDPLTSPIKLIREGNILRADGTSLGADDGIAAAIAMFLLQQKDVAHGPLRLIFTVDEETAMTGATHLDKKYVQDAKYIINCDSEYMDILCIGSAGSCHTHFNRDITWQEPAGNLALSIKTCDFLGGHSGETINSGKSNGIQALAFALLKMADKGISYQMASMNGGNAANAIPASAEAVIVLDKKDLPAVQTVLKETKDEFDLIYGEVEQKAHYVCEETAMPAKTFSQDDTDAVVQLLSILHCGVFAMNQLLPKLPDLSASIGTIATEENRVTLQYFPRASADAILRQLLMTLPVYGKCTGFTVEMGHPEPAWTKNPHSTLLPVIAQAYTEEAGREPRLEAMHGGLETGYFYSMNQNLDIVSVGPTTHDIHSADESVELDTVALLVRIIAKTLGRLK
ncbi:MAG: beta-Ala-His dipeptidase [Megasphaera sp.]|jgi:dipeptidase D|nr:beta-Ala-His dipeptidase [Megasphaera sp.]MCI1247837.1 beta-Ala-His dipeptidase [Megasphaera sp.]